MRNLCLQYWTILSNTRLSSEKYNSLHPLGFGHTPFFWTKSHSTEYCQNGYLPTQVIKTPFSFEHCIMGLKSLWGHQKKIIFVFETTS